MRKECILSFLICAVSVSPGQMSVRTPSFSFGSPSLSIRGDFLGEKGTTWLNAGAGGTLVLSISNSGKATARGAVVAIVPVAPLKGIQVTGTDSLGDVPLDGKWLPNSPQHMLNAEVEYEVMRDANDDRHSR